MKSGALAARLRGEVAGWRMPGPSPRAQARGTREAIALLEKAARAAAPHPLALPEQPFDSLLLRLSPLYRRSRELYLEGGGSFRAAMISSPRSLGSISLLDNAIEYSPVETELRWAAAEPRERGAGADDGHLLKLRSFVASLYHEQNHRLIWRQLPPPANFAPRERRDGIHRYLNLVESFAITMDMALGDELGPDLCAVFYQLGLIYDRGTDVRRPGMSRRAYRNYLQAALYATFLNLELYNPAAIPAVISVLYPQPDGLAERAARRSLNLDRAFVERTNPVWQARHGAETFRRLRAHAGKRGRNAGGLSLSGEVTDNRLPYLHAENWFGSLGL